MPLRVYCARQFHIFLLLLSSTVLFSCSTSTPPTTPQLVTVYSTSAAQPWLTSLYACAESSAVLSRVDDPAGAEILLRVGEPPFLASPAFQIDTEEILIVTHRQSPIQTLTFDLALPFFPGQREPALHMR